MSRLIDQATCDRLRRLAEVHGLPTAAAIVGVRSDTARRIRQRGWRAAIDRRSRRPRPSDFAIQCGALKIKELCVLYAAGDATVRRWARKVGRVYEKPRRVYVAMPRPDGGAAALARYGNLGTPVALSGAVAAHGAAAAARMYGVSYGTLRLWRHALNLPIGWSRQPGAKRGRTPAPPSRIGWADKFFLEARSSA